MLTRLPSDTHEEVWRVEDVQTGLKGFIALHSTALGPAAGGLRMKPYKDESEALQDALRLSRGMSYKNAAAELPLGGGKAVIIGDPARDKTPALLRAMGRAVAMLEGRYWTAEDMGMTPRDMAELARETTHVAGLAEGEHASGDPSPVTARGVFNAMQIGATEVFDTADLAGRRVAVQGLGHVGWHLCNLLHEAGAHLIVADIDAGRVRKAARTFAAATARADDIHATACDIFAPCAIGGILNAQTIPHLKARLIAGAANNQLSEAADADRLHARQILYLPDYVVNAGGIINVAGEILQIPDRPRWVGEKLEAIARTIREILERAKREKTSPGHLADRIMEDRLLRRAE